MTDSVDSGIPPPRRARVRQCARVGLDGEVVLRRPGQNRYRVRIYDVSPNGCKVEFVERPSLDELVWIKFDGLEALEALVCWIKGFAAGLEFQRAIHQSVFEMLVQRLDSAGPE